MTNKAQSIINDSSRDTKKVENPVFVPKEAKVVKAILIGGKQQTSAAVELDKEFQYVVNFSVGDEEELTFLRLYDALESVHTFVDAKVFDQDGKDITNQGTLTTSNKTFDWKAAKPNDYAGKTLQVVITAKLNNVPELSQYLVNGTIQVPNIAKMIMNTKEISSNKVTVTPPRVDTKAEKFIVKE